MTENENEVLEELKPHLGNTLITLRTVLLQLMTPTPKRN